MDPDPFQLYRWEKGDVTSPLRYRSEPISALVEPGKVGPDRDAAEKRENLVKSSEPSMESWYDRRDTGFGGEDVMSIAISYDDPAAADEVLLDGFTIMDADRCGNGPPESESLRLGPSPERVR